ncbi:hypothetical protein JCM6882_001021 [Rhodosporidiobolus microsporus]
MSSVADALPTRVPPSDDGEAETSVALPRQPPTPAAIDDEEEAASPSTEPSSAASSADETRTTSALSEDEAEAAETANPPATSSTAPSLARPSRTLAAALSAISDKDPTIPITVPSIRIVTTPLTLPSILATLPLSARLSLLPHLPSDAISSAPALLSSPTASSAQGFATTIRRVAHPAPEATGVFAPSPTLEHPRPSETESQAVQRANSTGMFTGVSLAGLLVILLLLIISPRLKSCCVSSARKRAKQEDDADSLWGTNGVVADHARRGRREGGSTKSWGSGLSGDSGFAEIKDEKLATSSSLTLVEHPDDGGAVLMKENVAGIGRRNTLKSIINVPVDILPPQAEFVAFPRTPTIIYSPPPREPEPPIPFSPPRRVYTPQSFPSTPTYETFPPAPSRTPLPPGHYPPSTPPLSGLYSNGEWQRILHSPPILSPPSTVAGSSRGASPVHLIRHEHDRSPSPLASVDYDDDASIYSRPSMMLPSSVGLTPAHQRPPLPLLPMRLEGLAAAAARSRVYNELGGPVESFPVTPSTEYAEDSVVGVGWKRGR